MDLANTTAFIGAVRLQAPDRQGLALCRGITCGQTCACWTASAVFTEQNTFAITNAIDIEQAEALQLPRQRARALGLDAGCADDWRALGRRCRSGSSFFAASLRCAEETNTQEHNWQLLVLGVKGALARVMTLANTKYAKSP